MITTWNGDVMITGGVTSQTLSGATLLVKRSKVVVLGGLPFENAPSTPITIRVICN
ncbi:hypothetical protein [Methylobacterium sp. Leaf88]|uniref:hypothetical protein n=1 Tax=Methylobacterium sp. Leaf88 TaxID=1736244 RepID=UPI000A8053DB|nr:hypothetical protein [Methylobacterium sp. Leaf88]